MWSQATWSESDSDEEPSSPGEAGARMVLPSSLHTWMMPEQAAMPLRQTLLQQPDLAQAPLMSNPVLSIPLLLAGDLLDSSLLAAAVMPTAGLTADAERPIARRLFAKLVFVIDAGRWLSVARKRRLTEDIQACGGVISYLVTRDVDFVVTEQGHESPKLTRAMRLGVYVVSVAFVEDCIAQDFVLDANAYRLANLSSTQDFAAGKVGGAQSQRPSPSRRTVTPAVRLADFAPGHPTDLGFEYPADYQLIRFAIFSHSDGRFACLELHGVDEDVAAGRFRVHEHTGQHLIKEQQIVQVYHAVTALVAEGLYAALYDAITAQNFIRQQLTAPRGVGSQKLELQLCTDAAVIHSDIADATRRLVQLVYNEANQRLRVSLETPLGQLSPPQIEQAQAVLLSLKHALEENNTPSYRVRKLSDEFYALVPHAPLAPTPVIDSLTLLSDKQDLTQLMLDMCALNETAAEISVHSPAGALYKALHCAITPQLPGSFGHRQVVDLCQTAIATGALRVINVYMAQRAAEDSPFWYNATGNRRLLLHASPASNAFGILSRGLLVPQVVVDSYGGMRRDAGMLGTGIYFAEDPLKAARYSGVSKAGTRFMFVSEVALGRCHEILQADTTLAAPPPGYQSVCGVGEHRSPGSSFDADEYVIYRTSQQRLQYLIEFTLPGDKLIDDSDNTVAATAEPHGANVSGSSSGGTEPPLQSDNVIDLTDVLEVADPLLKVQAGLQAGGMSVPLQGVHVRAQLVDLVAQVVVLQVYENRSTQPIEAKYVFPLDDMAAVCGFEAFINDKHVLGVVKEKEQAHREFKEAISKGHGAYLMDEETPEVFTVSVGNLPPAARVVIKITYVTELAVEEGDICFTLPGSVAPCRRDQALSHVTQNQHSTVPVGEDLTDGVDMSVQLSLQTQRAILQIQSPTHRLKIKQTDTMATVAIDQSRIDMRDGFVLLVRVAEIHTPRMWVEQDPVTGHHACMLTFFPEFEADTVSTRLEYIFVVDLSCSMQGAALTDAKKILLAALHHLPSDANFNVVAFGDFYTELFPMARAKTKTTMQEAAQFVSRSNASWGSTALWQPLRSILLLGQLAKEKAGSHLRNVFLFSDGLVQDEAAVMDIVRAARPHTRLFSCGVGPGPAKHFLRSLANLSGGTFELFDAARKSKWERKVRTQIAQAATPGLRDITVRWHQHDVDAPDPEQAPAQLASLFYG